MIYKAQDIDTDKALDFLHECLRDTHYNERLEREKIEKYYSGYRDGLDRAINMFSCKNYEKDKKVDD